MKIENKIPPPVVAFLAGVAMLFLAAGTQKPISTLQIIGIVLFWIAGTGFSVAGILSFRKAKTTVNPLKPETATHLVTSGVYRATRNPMYLGLALVLLAWASYLGSAWTLLGVAAFVAYITRFQIVPEERAMLVLFGDEFTQYTKKVRRWI